MRSSCEIPREETPEISGLAHGAPLATGSSRPDQFRLLVHHLLDRFFNNEMVSVGGETLPLIITIAGAIAVPTLIVAVFLFPSYHAFPPRPPVPPFWTQVCEHYFFVVYSMVAMGVVTVFEADLLFPSLLDMLILTPLPIPHRRLVLTRVSATLIFLVSFLFGMNSLGLLAYAPMTELHVGRLFLANFVSVLAAGTFCAAVFVALQGILISLLSDRLYRHFSVALQCAAVAVLLSILLSFTKVCPLLDQLTLRADTSRWFPPFWFLGLYEAMLAGSSRLQQFVPLAHDALWGTASAVLVAVGTYPVAYLRRMRHAIEGEGVQHVDVDFGRPFRSLLHATLLRVPPQRAVYHFITQSLRTPKHRVYLAMYAGIGIALIITGTFGIRVTDGAIELTTYSNVLRTIVPGVAFWVVSGLCTALTSPADPDGGWVFPVTSGKPTTDQLDAARLWVTVCASLLTDTVIMLFWRVAPRAAGSGKQVAGHLFIGTVLCVLLSDCFLLTSRTIPFTEPRIPRNTDLAWVLMRYIVMFPVVVIATTHCEPWATYSLRNLAASGMAVFLLHSTLRRAQHRAIEVQMHRADIDELTGILPGLGLEQ